MARNTSICKPSFNPRTHVGCDGCKDETFKAQTLFQSTHPRGVRPIWDGRLPSATSFNPRTHVGCDKSFLFKAMSMFMFQSTHPRGVRRNQFHYTLFYDGVSIHAPTWGATDMPDFVCQLNEFQSTHPRGVRPMVRRIPIGYCGFNPRTHVGCDSSCIRMYMSVSGFQSTHPRGVRPGDGWRGDHEIIVSIHAPTWGATTGLRWRR